MLRLKDKWAGKTGYCPRCKTRITVPGLHAISDDEILDIMGNPSRPPPEPIDDGESVFDKPMSQHGDSGSGLLGSSKIQGRKLCPECGNLCSFSFSICPKCGTPLPRSATAEA